MRNLSVEYLRLIFISLIVLLHILWIDYGGLKVVVGDYSLNAFTQLGLTNLTSLGVTGFILISGYYGVKLKLNRIVSLWLQTTIYSILSVALLFTFSQIGGGKLLYGIIDAPLRLFDGWWFLSDYLILMLLSPLINIGIKTIGKKELQLIIIMLSFTMYGVEWFHARNASMPLLLFFNTYLIGRYIRLYPISILERYKYVIFLTGVTLLVVEPMLLHLVGMDSKMKFVGGNFNVLIIIVNIAALLICEKHIKNGKTNMFTRNVLAVYLIHTSKFGSWILHDVIFCDGLAFDILFILFVVLSVVIICVIIEEIRCKITSRIENGLSKFIDSKINIFTNL